MPGMLPQAIGAALLEAEGLSMGKGSARRIENSAAVRDRWPFSDPSSSARRHRAELARRQRQAEETKRERR